jgi:NADPH:quinone reductase-like Zn-dependent oxidoreductase
VGPAVTQFQRGDAVYAMLPVALGGGYAEYVATSADAVALLPQNLSFVEAAAVPLAALTSLQALRDKAALQPGAAVLIYGASGGVGTFGVQIAKALGAQVTAVCSTGNIDRLRQIGADDVLDYTRQNLADVSPRYDVVFDAVNVLSLRQARRLLRPNGVAVTVNPIKDKFAPDWLARFQGGRRVRSLLVQPSAADLQTLTSWIESGKLRPIIDRCYPLADVAEAHRYSETMRVCGKLVLVVDQELSFSSGSLQQQRADRRSSTRIQDNRVPILQ